MFKDNENINFRFDAINTIEESIINSIGIALTSSFIKAKIQDRNEWDE
jgi:hypothetical protein